MKCILVCNSQCFMNVAKEICIVKKSMSQLYVSTSISIHNAYFTWLSNQGIYKKNHET